MTIYDITECVAKAEDSKTKKSEVVEVVKYLALEVERLIVKDAEVPKVKTAPKKDEKYEKAIEALTKCAKKEMSIYARRALKELA